MDEYDSDDFNMKIKHARCRSSDSDRIKKLFECDIYQNTKLNKRQQCALSAKKANNTPTITSARVLPTRRREVVLPLH